MRHLTIVLLVSFGIVTYGISQPSGEIVELSLALEPDYTLPGIPTTLKLIAKNQSLSEVRLPEAMVLKVTPENGEPFVAKTGQGYYGWLDKEFILKPGESKEIRFDVGGAIYSGWFVDPRLSYPGVYQLQIVMDRDPDPKLVDGVVQKDPGEPRKINSTIATLNVKFANSEDTLVWDRIQEASQGNGWGTNRWWQATGLAREIVDRYPTSNYVPFLAGIAEAENVDEKIAICERVAATFPSSRGIDRVHETLALLYSQEMYRAFQNKDLIRAQTLYDKKTEHLVAVITKTKDPILKEKAKRKKLKWKDEYQTHYVNWSKKAE